MSTPLRRQSLSYEEEQSGQTERRSSLNLSASSEKRRGSLIIRWFKHFSDAAEAYNRREGKTKRPEPQPDSDESETLQEIPSTKDVAERADAVGGTENAPDDEEEDEQVFSDAQEEGSANVENKEGPSSSEGGGVHTKITADEWPLIQPSQVHVEVPPVHTAESRLTPLEQIRRKDEEVRRALEDKEGLVADFLSIPREHFHLIADMASDTQEVRPNKDLAERVLAAVYQVDQLHLAVNEALNVTEASAISATGGKHQACQSQEMLVPSISAPAIPANRVKDVANSLSTQLTTLLSDVKQAQEEHDRLRKELFRLRERLHEQQLLHGPNEDNVSQMPTEPQDLDSIKESPTEPQS